jgi:hypothetical protein
MPATKRPKPLYQRGDYALYRREGRANLEIVWYDGERKRERSISAGTGDLRDAKQALDRKFLEASGSRYCPTCHRPWDHEESPYLASAIADYLVVSEAKAGFKSARSRLAHVLTYLASKPQTRCADVDQRWVDAFRKWLLAQPFKKGDETRERTLGAVEGSVLQLAAAINATPGQQAQFKADQPRTVAQSPTYRADVPTIAAMFRFALTEPHRINLLRYLRLAVATWARPDAIFDATAAQWLPQARVLDLNTPGRRQTRKYRPKVPIARQLVPYLDSGDVFLPVTLIRSTWDKMRAELGLPGNSQAGEKLIRRSMATLARKRIGEANWRQGEMMLGHVKASVSDIYALPDPANLGLALAATEAIIDEIEALAPGAYRVIAAPKLSVVSGKSRKTVERVKGIEPSS